MTRCMPPVMMGRWHSSSFWTAAPSAETENVQVTFGANSLDQTVLNEMPSFMVIRILYHLNIDKVKGIHIDRFPFAMIINI